MQAGEGFFQSKNAVNPEQMKALIQELKQEFDYILIDCPAGIEQGYKNAVAGADKAIVVATPEISSVRDADRIIGLLEQEDIEPPKLVINRSRSCCYLSYCFCCCLCRYLVWFSFNCRHCRPC